MKIVYFSPDSETTTGTHPYSSPLMGGGRLHFRKFEASKMDQCMKFIEQKRLHLGAEGGKAVVKATGGGAFKWGPKRCASFHLSWPFSLLRSPRTPPSNGDLSCFLSHIGYPTR